MAPKWEPKRRDPKNLQRGSVRKPSFSNFPDRGNLSEHFIRLYGEEILTHTKSYSKLLIRKSSLLCDLAFLKSCRDHRVIPKSLQVKHHNKSHHITKILHKANLALLINSIHSTRRELNTTNTLLYKTYTTIQSFNIHPCLWDNFDRLSHNKAEYISSQKTKTQKRKLSHLISIQTPEQLSNSTEPRTLVHNLSDTPISDIAIKALAKGFNFALTPQSIPTEQIISQTEDAIKHLQPDDAENTRQDIARILRSAKPPPSNLATNERRELKNLRNNQDVIILPADKGNSTVILNTTDYIHKMNNLLDSTDYKQIPNDPTTYLEKKTRTIINNSNLEPIIKKDLIPREKSSRIPRIYGLPKIHKPTVPLRPIVSAYNSPNQKLAQYLANTLQPLAEKATSYVKDSYHFINLLKTYTISPSDLLVSFDIVSLFTSIPLTETLDILKTKHNISDDTLSLIQHCMSNTYFLFQGKFYKQIQGAPMGSPLSPVLANIFMENLETHALSTAELKPTCWLRYVDDTFVIWPHGRDSLNTFLTHLNQINPQIQFTMEIENNSSLPFLDVRVTKTINQSFSYSVYRKPTHTNRYLNANSHHHPAQLNSLIRTLVSRSLRLTDNENKQTELNTLQTTLQQNGYDKNHIARHIRNLQKPTSTQIPNTETPQQNKAYLPYIKGVTDRISRILKSKNIKTTFTTHQKLSSILRNPKDIIPNESHGVYEIPCSDCSQTYIGQTNRRIHNRIYEHKLATRNSDTSSALAKHHIQTGHKIDFDKTKTIAAIYNYRTRIIREAIEIEKRPNCLNKRDDGLRLPAAWKPLIGSLRTRPHSQLDDDTSRPTYNRRTPTTPPTNMTRDIPINSRTSPQTRQIALRSRQIEASETIGSESWGPARLRPRTRTVTKP